MLNNITIQGFKCIDQESIDIAPLTILTGINSSGKSTVIQAILLTCRMAVPANRYSLLEITTPYSNVREVRNKIKNSQSININLNLTGCDKIESLELSILDIDESLRFTGRIHLTKNQTMEDAQNNSFNHPPAMFLYENIDETFFDEAACELFYLNANRIGPQDIAPISETKVGNSGENIFGYFNEIQAKPLADELVNFPESKTLSYQVGQWISYITETQTELKTHEISPGQVSVKFDTEGLSDISASNLGAGMSYVSKIIILCLIAKKKDLVIIENPEIHLHPKSQSRLGEFFTFISNAGINLIIETHCEHIINKIRYDVYKKKISNKNIIIQYKSSINDNFQPIYLDSNGKYRSSENKNIIFPTGFFDSSLHSLIEMGG
ncbi:TPA: AAA family ATPase [Photobacterium damselae]